MDGYTITQEPLAHLMGTELAPLFEAYFAELVRHPHVSQLDIKASAPIYAQAEASGGLFWIALRHGSEIVGFTAVFTVTHHQFGYRCAQSDLLYIKPEHRGSGQGRHLIAATEEAARGMGCEIMSWGLKPGTPAAHFFASRGYTAGDVYYVKEL